MIGKYSVLAMVRVAFCDNLWIEKSRTQEKVNKVEKVDWYWCFKLRDISTLQQNIAELRQILGHQFYCDRITKHVLFCHFLSSNFIGREGLGGYMGKDHSQSVARSRTWQRWTHDINIVRGIKRTLLFKTDEHTQNLWRTSITAIKVGFLSGLLFQLQHAMVVGNTSISYAVTIVQGSL